MFRGWLTATLLGLATVAAAVMAVETSPARATERVPAAGPAPDAPVLSPRRVPEVLRRGVADTRLVAALDRILAERSGATGDAACLVVRHRSRTLYERQADEPLIPASTMKVLTGIAALSKLGPSTRFTTEVRANRPPEDGVVDGALWLVGGGDPLLQTPEYAATFRNQPQVFTDLTRLAEEIVSAGVREIRGGVVGDESRYDTQRYVPTWKQTYIADGDVGPASALVVNDGFVQFVGRKVPAPSPPQHAAAVLESLLQARGVAVAEPARAGPAGADSVRIAAVESLPVGEIVAEMLSESDNLTAELLAKEMGKRFAGAGTTAAGVTALRDALDDEGFPVERVTLIDGSGLDRGNRATCAALMEAVTDAGPDSALAKGFAVANRTGTLARRFVGSPAAGRLRAKTGSLEGVAGLVGFVDGAPGGPLAFALLSNAVPSEEAGRVLQERVGAALAAYPDAPDAAELAP